MKHFIVLFTLLIISGFSSATGLNPQVTDSLKQCFSNTQPFTIKYELDAGYITADSKHTLRKSNGHWVYKSKASKSFVGKIIETSKFSIQDNGAFKLREYDSYRRIAFNTDERTITPVWEQKTLRVSDKSNQSFNTNIMFDKASQQLAVQCLIRSGYYGFELPIVDRHGVEHKRYQVRSIDDVKTHNGTFQAIKVEQIRDDDRKIFFWVAPEMDYIPIKFTYFEGDEKEFEAIFKSYQQ